jgi:hypothetical protein
LRKSVAGFRLPDFGGGTTTLGASTSSRLPALKEPPVKASTGATGTTGTTGTIGTSGNTGTTGTTGKVRKASGFGA